MKASANALRIQMAAASVLAVLMFSSTAIGQTVLPDRAPAFGDDFERDTLEDWNIVAGSVLNLQSGIGPDASIALAVTVSAGESHLIRGGSDPVARADEAYFSFWFHPNGVTYTDPGFGFIPDRSIQLAAIKGSDFRNLVGIALRRLSGGNYVAYIQWRDSSNTEQFDFASGSFPIANGWQRITIGYRANEWVAAWVDGVSVRAVTGVDHLEPRGTVIEIGKTVQNSSISPTGVMRFDDPQLEVPKIASLWVNAASGDDNDDGLTPATALASIDRASDLAAAGTTVRIMPGVYRGPVVPAQGGTGAEPVIYRAENGRDSVIVRGAVPSSELVWTQLASNSIGLPPGTAASNIWWTDLSSWGLTSAPRFVVRMSGADQVEERLPKAREPDWSVQTDYKPSEFWWSATGGNADAGCDPMSSPDCDTASQSETQITDTANDTDPVGVEAGNLTTLGDLTGGTIFSLDTSRGHYHYRRQIVSHNVGAGLVTVDTPCIREGNPGLGWGSKYYVEGLPGLLDQSGEWWFDASTDRLYLWPPSPGSPASQSLEISRWDTGFDLRDRSWVTLDSLVVELYNGVAVENHHFIAQKSVGNRVVGSLLQWVNRGVELFHQVQAGVHDDKRIEGFVVGSNEIAHADTHAIKVSYVWDGGSDADLWTRAAVFDTTIRDNLIRDIGFSVDAGEDSTGSVVLRFPDRLKVLRNTIRDTATEGMLVLESVVQSPDTWGFAPSEIVVGEVLIKDNVVVRACTMKSDCGGIRIWGPAPDNHVYRDFLLMGNSFLDTVGWGWANQKRSINSSGQIEGAGGSGIYFDQTAGVHTYRNIAYNNGLAGAFVIKTWRDGLQVFVSNVLADNLIGIRFGGFPAGTHDSVDTRFLNNIMVNNEGYGFSIADDDGVISSTTIDRNLYDGNGWGSTFPGPGAFLLVEPGGQTQWTTVPAIQANSPFETGGQAGDPAFVDYDPNDHDPFDGSRPDFHLRKGSSVAVDAGTVDLPASLDSVLALFGLTDARVGTRWDQGAFEGPVVVPGDPIFSDGFESGNTSSWSQAVGE